MVDMKSRGNDVKFDISSKKNLSVEKKNKVTLEYDRITATGRFRNVIHCSRSSNNLHINSIGARF